LKSSKEKKNEKSVENCTGYFSRSFKCAHTEIEGFIYVNFSAAISQQGTAVE